MKTITHFFWNRDYPARSLTRVFTLVSIVIYIGGRIVDPGPVWAKEFIETLIYDFNLCFIKGIALLAPTTTSFWQGSGFSLQMEVILTWPLACAFAIWAGWLNRNGSKEFEKYPPIIKKPSIKNWLKNVFPITLIFFIAYSPFYGSDAISYSKPAGLYSRIFYDTYITSMFWMLYGWAFIHLSMVGFYVINAEFKLTFNKVS